MADPHHITLAKVHIGNALSAFRGGGSPELDLDKALAALGQEKPEERWTKGRHVSAQFFGGHEILDEKGEVIAVVAWHADRVARLPELERAAWRLVSACCVANHTMASADIDEIEAAAATLSSILEQKP